MMSFVQKFQYLGAKSFGQLLSRYIAKGPVTHLLVSVPFTKRNLQPVSIFKYQYLTSHYYLFIVCNARAKIRLMGLVL